MKVIDYKKLNTNKIVYKNPKKINDYLFAPMKYNNDGEEIPILIQTPKLNNFNRISSVLFLLMKNVDYLLIYRRLLLFLHQYKLTYQRKIAE